MRWKARGSTAFGSWILLGLGIVSLVAVLLNLFGEDLLGRRSPQPLEGTPPPLVEISGTERVLVPVDTAPPQELGNRSAPDFALQTLDGQTFSLSELRGKRVLINFLATWCGPCRLEMPILETIYQQHRDEDFSLVAVNLEETEAQIRPYVEELGLSFPITLDSEGEVATDYGVRGLPTSFFVDREGIIFREHIGAMEEALILQILSDMSK